MIKHPLDTHKQKAPNMRSQKHPDLMGMTKKQMEDRMRWMARHPHMPTASMDRRVFLAMELVSSSSVSPEPLILREIEGA